MANKKISQLTSKPSVLVTDLFPIADPTTGQLFKTTISDLGTAIGSGVSSVNTLVGAVVLDTDDIQELASPTNRWYTDTRSRAALSASSPLVYNSGTGAFSIPAATTSVNGYLTSADWTTFNAKQAALSGTGFVKISGTIISYDNSTYLTTSAAASTYLALAGGTLTGALNGTSANFSGDLTLTGTNPRFYLTDSDNNPDYFISNTDGTFTVYDVTNSTSRFTIGTTGNGTFGGNLTVGQIIRSGGTSAQFLKADGSVDSSTYLKGSGTATYLASWTSTANTLTDSFISFASNITTVEGMGLSTLNGLNINGNYGAGGGGQKIRSFDETTGIAYIDFANTGGRMYLGVNRSTANGLMTNASAYATVLSSGLGTTNLEFGTNLTKRLTLDGTTGAATFTSTITATGGTLTGALSGTSASFSATSTFNGLSTGVIAFFNAPTNGGTITFQTGGVSFADIGSELGNFGTGSATNLCVSARSGKDLILGGGALKTLILASTGAATFSSSVTASSFSGGTLSINTTTSSERINVNGAIGFQNTSSVQKFHVFYSTGSGGISFTETGVADNRLFLKDGGNVGIGTAAPSAKLHAVNAGNGFVMRYAGGTSSEITGGIFASTASGFASIGTQSAHAFNIFTNDNDRLSISDSGVTKIFNLAGTGSRAVLADSTGVLSAPVSDISVKQNIKPIGYGLNEILKMNPVWFDFVDEYKNYGQGRQNGNIAQEMEKIIPEAVFITPSTNKMGINYEQLHAVYIKAIQELKAKIETLENK